MAPEESNAASRMRARVTSDFLIEVAVVIFLNVFENRMTRTARHVKDYLNVFISRPELALIVVGTFLVPSVRSKQPKKQTQRDYNQFSWI